MYLSEAGGFQNLASYTGETERSWVTRVIQGGSRSIVDPSGFVKETYDG